MNRSGLFSVDMIRCYVNYVCTYTPIVALLASLFGCWFFVASPCIVQFNRIYVLSVEDDGKVLIRAKTELHVLTVTTTIFAPTVGSMLNHHKTGWCKLHAIFVKI